MNGINENEPSYEVKNCLSYQTNEGHIYEKPDCGEASEKAPSVSINSQAPIAANVSSKPGACLVATQSHIRKKTGVTITKSLLKQNRCQPSAQSKILKKVKKLYQS